MAEEIKLDNIDEMIDFWRKECDDLSPFNVDSMDRPALDTPPDATARKAICLVPALLEKLKAYMVREQVGHETELSQLAEAESQRWLHRLLKFFDHI